MGFGVGDVDQAQGGGVLEQQTESVAAFDDGPVVGAGVTQAAVLGFREVQVPRVAVHGEIEALHLHEPAEVVETHPSADGAPGQRVGDGRAAPRHRRHRSPALAAGLPLDRVDAVELVQQLVPEPPFPDGAQRLRRRRVQRGAAGPGQRQLRPAKLGQSGCLHEAGPGERPDRTDLPHPLGRPGCPPFVVVAAREPLGEAPARGGARPSRAGADGDAPRFDQPQDREQVVLRGLLHVAPRQRHAFGQLVRCRDLGLGRRRHPAPQAFRQLQGHDRRLGAVAPWRVEEEMQKGGGRRRGSGAEAGGQPAVLQAEALSIEEPVRRVQGLAHGELLDLVERVPQAPQRVAAEQPLDLRDHLRLAPGRRCGVRQQRQHRPKEVRARKLERLGHRRQRR